MPRNLDPGTYSDAFVIVQRGDKIQARARYRDPDGETRLVARTGKTEAEAKNRLKRALRDRQGAGGEHITNRTRIDALADQWLAQAHPEWSVGTRRTYTYVTKRIKKALGGLKIEEATPAAIGRALAAIHAEHPSSAKSVRACLNGMFNLAIAHGATQRNPVRDAPVTLTIQRKRARSLTRAQADAFSDWLRTDPRASQVLDLPDLVDWMLATGCRLGEALAARHGVNTDGEPLIDLDAGTWEINATLIRTLGAGLLLQEQPKTATSWRIIPLPSHAVAMLERRRAELRPTPAQIVFGAPTARSWRDPSNTDADLRETLARYRDQTGTDLTWVTSHTFRKTAATWLEEAGFTTTQIADHLGHANPSLTLDRYIGRRAVQAAAAAALER